MKITRLSPQLSPGDLVLQRTFLLNSIIIFSLLRIVGFSHVTVCIHLIKLAFVKLYSESYICVRIGSRFFNHAISIGI